MITVVKKLAAYTIAVTEKSPKKFRGVFVNRMQNYCLDTIEYLLEANFIRMDSIDNKLKRENLQKEAIVKLKMLGYISMVAENLGCILKKQYTQISLQLTEAINLIVAWKKSDDKTQIGKVKNGIDFLGYRHILNSNGKIIRKLRQSSKIRLKKHLRTLEKLRTKDIVDDEYVYIRKNAFYNHVKDTSESKRLKESTIPVK